MTENTRAAYPLDHIAHHVAGGPGAAIRGTSSCSPRTPSACCRRSRGSRASRRCTTSSRATRRRSPGTERASRSRRRRSAPASARRSCRCTRRVYANMLGERLEKHDARVWLVNTGWTGGPYGVGERMKLAHTRAMVRAALSGELTGRRTRIPCSGSRFRIDSRRRRRCSTRAARGRRGGVRRAGENPGADVRENFARFAGTIDEAIAAAGPKT